MAYVESLSISILPGNRGKAVVEQLTHLSKVQGSNLTAAGKAMGNNCKEKSYPNLLSLG
jgi:hypothetical protein